MTDERIHHPSCSSRWGGLCSGCPSSSRTIGGDHEPDITCSACGETYLIAAENPIARARALRDWPGCPCTQDTLRPGGPVLNVIGEELPGRGVTKPQGLARWVSGVPAWVRRRQAVAW